MPASSADREQPVVIETLGPTAQGFSFVLEECDGVLRMRAQHHPDYGAIHVDWGSAELRRRIAGGRRQLLTRAFGLHNTREKLHILDATAGLGRDGYTLAAMGAEVTMCERHPLIHALLSDALRRAIQDASTAPTATRIHILASRDAGEAMAEARYDAVYLDPMYPHSGKSALPQKEMQLFRELTSGDPDAHALLQPALDCARRRVVTKRPLKAAWLAGREPTFSLGGTQARYDIYICA